MIALHCPGDLGPELFAFGQALGTDADEIEWHSREYRRGLPGLFERSDPRVRFIARSNDGRRMPGLNAGEYPPHKRLPGFLKADPELVARYRAELPCRPVVGLLWRRAEGDCRNVPPAEFAALADLPASFVSLQYAEPDEEIGRDVELFRCAGLDVAIHKGWDALLSLEQHAAFTDACDVVVTVPGSGAHFAGALGKPTFLLCAAEFVKRHGRGLRTCWANFEGAASARSGPPPPVSAPRGYFCDYESVTGLYQDNPGDWRPVMAELRQRLKSEEE